MARLRAPCRPMSCFALTPSRWLGEWDRWQIVLSVLLFLTFTVSFSWLPDGATPRWAILSLVPIAAIACLRGLDRADILVLAFLAYAGLSLTWSPDAMAGAILWGRLALGACLFMAVRRRPISPLYPCLLYTSDAADE